MKQCRSRRCQAMDRCRALAVAAVKPDHGGDGDDDPDELAVFAAERYFYGDDALLWCGRSSSSLSVSSAFKTAGTLDHDRSVVPTPTAATSSSEASWNSRSALLPPNEPPPPAAEKLRVGAGTPVVAEAEPPCGAEGISERAGRRRASSSSSSSSLRRWLLGVAGCACAAGHGEESVRADEMEAGVGGKECNSNASRLSPRTETIPEPAFEEITAPAVTVKPGSGRWLLEGDRVLVERDSFSPIEITGHGHRRAPNSGELATPAVLQTATADEWRRVKSFEKLRPLGWSALGSATQNSSAFTIVAGGNAPRAGAGCGGGSPGGAEEEDDDAAAPSELGYAYPPSEASMVWSVVTADGAASGNFSSAASGYYNYHYFGEDGALRRHDAAAARCERRRKGGIGATTGSLLACMSDKAVDAVGPVHRPEIEPAAVARMRAAAGGRNDHGGGYQVT
ncbi:unnamed protein product [Urochloa humidicola]